MKKTLLVCGIVLCVIVLSTITITNYNKQEYKESTKEIIQSNSLAMYIIDEDGAETKIEEYPDPTEYTLNTEKSYCKNGSTLVWEDGKIIITTSKSDKCVVYFTYKLAAKIKKHAEANNYLYSTIPDFSKTTSDGEYGLYKAQDDYGDSYYFRGDVENNYVEFGSYAAGTTVNGTTYTKETPIYWRIIRINGDGTIRMIYDGTTLSANGKNSTDTIGTVVFNTTNSDLKHAGYTYDVNGTESDSIIKAYVDDWYKAHFYETKYEEYIADRIFCNDLEVSSTNGTTSYYAAYVRLNTNKNPKLTCTQDGDKYSKSQDNGNGLLKYPVALITADEVAMAGGVFSVAGNYTFLNTVSFYWTMTPMNFPGYPRMMRIQTGTIIAAGNVTATNFDARPVINLKADVLFEGNGTIDTPYKIITE